MTKQIEAIKQRSEEIATETEFIVTQWRALGLNDFFPASNKAVIRRYLRKLGLNEVFDAVEITSAKHGIDNDEDRFRYFCGVCNHKLNGDCGEVTNANPTT